MILRLILFLILNFGALAIGSAFTVKGVPSEWYSEITKAPWTPPGWVFGAAWTTIMVCFSIYMAYLWPASQHKNLLVALYAIQLVLNISWNPVFFHYHNVLMGLFIISALTILMGFFLFHYWPELKLLSALVLPYFIWLLIATSLNGYIYLNN